MATTTNYGWTTPNDTDLVKDGAAAIRTLGSSIDTTVFANASAGIAKTIVDAKGDIIAATAADTVSRLAVGANDTVLTADSTTATGLKWASSGGSAKNYTLVNAGGTSLSGLSTAISGLSSYDSLLVIIRGASASTASQTMYMSVNNVVTSNSYTRAGSVIKFPASYVNTMSEAQNASDTEIRLGTMGNNADSQVSGGVSIDGCRGTGVKALDVVFGTDAVSATANNNATAYKGVINATTAISSIEVFLASGTFDTGTLFVYGAV
jgi:hypothetical protein